MVSELPTGWAFFECFVTVDDPKRLTDARVALARANARPVREPGGHDFEITVANTHGGRKVFLLGPGAIRDMGSVLNRGHR